MSHASKTILLGELGSEQFITYHRISSISNESWIIRKRSWTPTLPDTNIAPKNKPLEKGIPSFETISFRAMLFLESDTYKCPQQAIPKLSKLIFSPSFWQRLKGLALTSPPG